MTEPGANDPIEFKTDVPGLRVDRPLDPQSAALVEAPGVGVVISNDTDLETIFRESADIAQVRGRLLYAIIIDEDITVAETSTPPWQETTYRIAHSLGADSTKLKTANLVPDLAAYCRQFDIRVLILENSTTPKFKFPWEKSMVDQITSSRDLPPTFVLRTDRPKEEKEKFRLDSDWVIQGAALLLVSFLGFLTRDTLPEAFQLLLFVFALAVTATRVSRLVSAVGSVLATLLYDYIHVGAIGRFHFADTGVWVNLIGLLVVSMMVSTLSWQLRTALAEARYQERRKAAFFNLTRDLLRTSDREDVVRLVEAHVRDVIHSDVGLFLKEKSGVQTVRPGRVDFSQCPSDLAARDLALNQGIEAGVGTHSFPLAYGLYLPLRSTEEVLGCLAVYPAAGNSTFPADQLRALDTFASLLAIAVERIHFEGQRRRAEQKIRDTDLQNTLLRSVSHDLKTPLTSITGYASQLADEPNQPVDTRVQTYETIRDESWRLTTLIDNLLSMTKLESGVLELNREVMFVEELVGTAVSQVRPRLGNRTLSVEIPNNLPDVDVDHMLLNQAIVNLVENAIKYTPEGSHIEVRARDLGDRVQISVLDDGPGLPPDGVSKVFEKFARFSGGRSIEGTGLGLAIVRAILELHGGTATARNRSSKGARFDLRLPSIASAPETLTISEPEQPKETTSEKQTL